MELSKIAGDTVWTAAALEGLANARVMEVLSSATARGGGGDGSGGLRRSLALPTGTAAAAAAAATAAPTSDVAAAGGGSTTPRPDRPPSSAAAATATTPQPPPSPRADAAASPGSPRGSPTKGGKGGGAGHSGSNPGYPLTNSPMWAALRVAGLEEEVKELLDEARGWYRKKGGALALQVGLGRDSGGGVARWAFVLGCVRGSVVKIPTNTNQPKPTNETTNQPIRIQIEQGLKLARFLAGIRGPRAARTDGLDILGGVLEMVPQLSLLEDRLVALVESAQVMGLLGCGRKRQLLLWAAVDLSRAVDRSEGLALRIATRALEGPDDAERQVGRWVGGLVGGA
jgi:hypothetical protein